MLRIPKVQGLPVVGTNLDYGKTEFMGRPFVEHYIHRLEEYGKIYQEKPLIPFVVSQTENESSLLISSGRQSMDRDQEIYKFPIVEPHKYDQSQLPLNKRRHVEEFPNLLCEPLLVSEEKGHSGKVWSQHDRDLLNQESQSSYSGVLDLERRILTPSEHSHHKESHLAYQDEAPRKDIPASEEGTLEVTSYQTRSTDEGQMCSPANFLTSGSQMFGNMQISGNCWTPATPMVTSPFSTEVLDDHPSTFDADENCQHPKMAEFDDNSELCTVGPIVNVKIPKLPSQFESIEELWEKFKSGGELIPNGGLEVCQVLVNEVKKKYSEHQKVSILDNERKLPRNLERSESNEAEHREKRLNDVKALKPVIKFVQYLEEELFIHLSQKIHHNLMEGSRLCEEANDGSHMAKVYQALQCDKDLCVIEVHVQIGGSCEKFPIVCLEGEKILHIVDEWLMKDKQGKRLHHKDLRLEACDSELVYPVGDSVEAFRRLHQVRLLQAADNPPLTSPWQPDFYGRGLSTTSYLQPVQPDWRFPHNSNLMVQPGGNSMVHPPSRQQDFQFGTETLQLSPLRHCRVNNAWHPSVPPPLSNTARYAQQHTESVAPNVDFWQPSHLPPPGMDPQPPHYH